MSRDQTRKLLETHSKEDLVEHWHYMETKLALAKEALEEIAIMKCSVLDDHSDNGEFRLLHAQFQKKARQALEKIK